MIARLPAQGQESMNNQQVNLDEIDGAYLLTYHDGAYERKVIFFDWTSAQANYERRAQEAQEAQESAGEHEK